MIDKMTGAGCYIFVPTLDAGNRILGTRASAGAPGRILMAAMTAIGIGLFLLVLGIHVWSPFTSGRAYIFQSVPSLKALAFIGCGAAISVAGAVRVFINKRGDRV